MNAPNVSLALGRLALSHEARKGMHLVQDPNSRHWFVVPSDRPVTIRERLRQAFPFFGAIPTLKPGKKSAAAALACIFGLVAAVAVIQFSLPSRQVPVTPVAALVPLAAAPEPNSISLNDAPYVDAAAVLSAQPQAVLPMPLNTSLPQAHTRGAIQPQRPAAAIKPAADDGPMAVFNEPLQLAKPSQQLTMAPVAKPGQELVTQAAPASSKYSASTKVRMLAVQSPTTIVVTNPATRLPMLVKVGEPLPDGSVLKSIDRSNSSAVNSRGDALVLQ